MPMTKHTNVASVSDALDLICAYALTKGWTLPYSPEFITAESIDEEVGTFDELLTDESSIPALAYVPDGPRSLYRRAHLVKDDLQINLACSYRGDHAAAYDADRVDYGEGIETGTINSAVNTPVPIYADRYDADKDGVMPEFYWPGSEYPSDGGWKGFRRRTTDASVNEYPCAAWIGVSACNNLGSSAFRSDRLWYKQDGDLPVFNAGTNKPIVKCCVFRTSPGSEDVNAELISATGPAIDDLWLCSHPDNDSIFVGMRQKVVYEGVEKHFYQFLYFGDAMTDYQYVDESSPQPGYFNASFAAHAPALGFDEDSDPFFAFHNSTGKTTGLPLGALANFNDTSHTEFLGYEATSEAPYNGSKTGGWGCGGGNISSGPLSRNGKWSSAHRAPIDDYVDTYLGQGVSSTAAGPMYAAYDKNRDYLKLLDVFCFRALDEGVLPSQEATVWEGVTDRGGVEYVGILPNILLTSMATINRDEPQVVTIDSKEYLLFPFFTLDAIFTNRVGDPTPVDPLTDTWQEISFHHRGVGMAICLGTPP